jgi:hypothetical protein
MPELIEFRVTFGIQYRTEAHPTFPAAHPSGWVTIMAPDETAAREVAFERLGKAWAFIYQDGWPGWPAAGLYSRFPLGELARWTMSEPTQVGS